MFGMSSPAAITRFVVPVIVDAVKFHPSRTLAHVSEKVLELPPFYRD
jgi:hypothetical protein